MAGRRQIAAEEIPAECLERIALDGFSRCGDGFRQLSEHREQLTEPKLHSRVAGGQLERALQIGPRAAPVPLQCHSHHAARAMRLGEVRRKLHGLFGLCETTTGKPTASATTTYESTASGQCRPCITGSTTWSTAKAAMPYATRARNTRRRCNSAKRGTNIRSPRRNKNPTTRQSSGKGPRGRSLWATVSVLRDRSTSRFRPPPFCEQQASR